MNKIIIVLFTLLAITLTLIIITYINLGPVGGSEQTIVFVVPQDKEPFDIVDSLKES